MYGFVWRQLPGPWPAKLAGMLVLLAIALAVLFYVVFPAIDPHLPFNKVTVQQDSPGLPAPTSPTPSPPVPSGTP